MVLWQELTVLSKNNLNVAAFGFAYIQIRKLRIVKYVRIVLCISAFGLVDIIDILYQLKPVCYYFE